MLPKFYQTHFLNTTILLRLLYVLEIILNFFKLRKISEIRVTCLCISTPLLLLKALQAAVKI